MKNILFNKNDYYNLAVQIRPQYENLGDDVYALKASSFRIDTGNLPKWLSVSQFNKYKNLISGHYMLVTRGFNIGVVKLMELIPSLARGVRTDFTNLKIPKETVITEKTFYRLNPSDKVKYNKVVRNGRTMYVTRGMPSSNMPTVAQTPVRPPTVGPINVPIGRWVEVK